MGGRAADDEPIAAAAPVEPRWTTTLLLALAFFAGLLLNGRAIGAGDTRPTEYLAASLVQEHDLDLDEYAEIVTPPFAQDAGGHRVSTYPVLSALLAAPVFALSSAFFALDEAGTALAGKIAASLLSALAGAVLFRAVARRRPTSAAGLTAALFVFATSVWSTSQALWQHPAAVLLISLALLFLLRAEYEPQWAERAGLPLALLVAARHADIGIAAALSVAVAIRWPRRLPMFVAWAAPGVLLVLGYQWLAFGNPLQHGFSGSLGRFSEPWGHGHVGLLLSPAKGLFVFTPVALVALVGLFRAFRSRTDVAVVKGPGGYVSVLTPGSRELAGACGAALLAHWLLIGRWAEWHGGESFGPRMMTDALPLLFLFLPDGLDLVPRTGLLLGALSVAVQSLGAFAYDYRWERLHQRDGVLPRAVLWDPMRSPILFHARERVVILGMPLVRDGRVYAREHREVLFDDTAGSRLSFGEKGLAVSGADRTFEDVHLQRGAQVVDGKLLFQGRWDALFLRVREGARPRTLELRVKGRGKGTLYVGEQSLLTVPPRWTAYPMNGSFHVHHPYTYAKAGGADLVVTTGKAPGEAQVESVALVAPGDAENPYQVPATK